MKTVRVYVCAQASTYLVRARSVQQDLKKVVAWIMYMTPQQTHSFLGITIDMFATLLATPNGYPDFAGAGIALLRHVKALAFTCITSGLPSRGFPFEAAGEVLQAAERLVDTKEAWAAFSDGFRPSNKETFFGQQSKKERDAGYTVLRPDGPMPFLDSIQMGLYDLVGPVTVPRTPTSSSGDGEGDAPRDTSRAHGGRDRSKGASYSGSARTEPPRPSRESRDRPARLTDGDKHGGALYAALNKLVKGPLAHGVCVGHKAMGLPQLREHHLPACDMLADGRLVEWAISKGHFHPNPK